MGAVWKVWHALSLGVFAIKEARSELRPDAKAAVLFLREIEVMRSLRHPNLVRLVDYGREGEEHYFVSEYQRGGSLQDRLAARGGFLPVCEAVAAVVDALAGLERMHEAGFVHRDIKPSNILFPKPGSGTARLADFGLSKRFLAAGSSGVTRPGESAGTVGFMSPEQISDYRRSDPRSDIYSMGATLYRLLSGRPPVQGGQEGVLETLEGKIKPLSCMAQLPGGQALPAGLAEVVMRALALDPRDRWEGARAFRTALAPYALPGPEVTDRHTKMDGPAVMNGDAGGRI
jgi:serine/threonine protein kinase